MTFTLHHEITGDGEPIVFVHGGWTDGTAWRFVAPLLAADRRVVTYDRRGHSRSGPSMTQVVRRVEEDDLIELLVDLDVAPAHLVGSSYGALLVLTVAARRPDLVRTVVAHEPPALSLAAGESWHDEVWTAMCSVADRIEAGEVEVGVRTFAEHLILGPGAWEQLPDATKASMMGNAKTFLDLVADETALRLDPEAVRVSGVPVLLTEGDQSPTWLRELVRLSWEAGVGTARHRFAGSGHMPHITDPSGLASAIRSFLATSPTGEEHEQSLP